MARGRKGILDKLGDVTLWQWLVVGASVLAIAVVGMAVLPTLLPKPKPIPQPAPVDATSAPAAGAALGDVPDETRAEVLAAAERDGIRVLDAEAVRVRYVGKKERIDLYGQFGAGSDGFKTYQYELRDGEWRQK